MADPVMSFPVSCRGGLNETATTRELQAKPGFASTLFNFEVSPDGGYRRINGYQKLGTLGKTPDVTETDILGTEIYNNGFIICKAGAIYYTYDGDDYTQVNKDMLPVTNPNGVSATDMIGFPVIPRPNASLYTFEQF